jgi:heme-binding NEAT domain protein
MAKKSFLLGLGLGMLLATLTLQLDFWKTSTDQAINKEELTIEQLRKEAEKFDYQLKTKTEIQLEIEKAIEQYKNTQKTVKPSSSNNAKPSTTKPSTTKPTTTSVKITIIKGWDATQVANHLYNKKIVKDKNALLRALVGLSKTRQIAAKSFYLEPSSDPKQVAQTITTGK